MESQRAPQNQRVFRTLHRVQFRSAGRQRENGDILRNIQLLTGVPGRLIHNQHRVSALRDCAGYLGEMELHPVEVAGREHKACSCPLLGADSSENPRGPGAQVSNRPGPGPPFCPPAGQLCFLADPCLVGPPDFNVLSGMSGPDRSNDIGELFLKMSWACVSCR